MLECQEERRLLFVCGADINSFGNVMKKGGKSIIADLQAEGHATDSMILTLGFTQLNHSGLPAAPAHLTPLTVTTMCNASADL